MSAGALEQVFANPLAANPNLFQQSLSNVTALRNFQAQQAQANAYRQAINPQTGALDTGRYNALLAATPQGAWGMGPAMQQAGQAQQAQGAGTSAALGARMQQMNALSGLMTPLLLRGEQGQPVTADDLNNVVQTAQQGGLINQGEADWARGQISRPGVNPIDLARGWWFMNQSAREQLAATTPTTAPMNVGGAVVYPGTNPYLPGYPQPGAALPRTMTPGEATSLDTVNIGNNQTIQMPHAQAVQLLGSNPTLRQLNPNVNLAAPSTGGPYSNNSFGPGYTGTYAGGQGGGGANAPAAGPEGAGRTGGATGTGAPVTATPLPTPPASAAPAPAAGAPEWAQPPPPLPTGGQYGGLGVSASPQVAAQQQAAGTASQGMLTGFQQQVQMVPQTRALLSDMRSEEASPDFQGGLGAQTASTFNRALAALHIGDQGDYNFANPQAAREAFKKDSSLLAQAQLKALGNSSAITDARQELTEASTPTVDMSDAGRRLLIHTLTGNQTAIQVMNNAWAQAQRAGWGPAQFSQWVQTFNQPDPRTGGMFDPRVYWLSDMTPQEQWEYGQKMKAGSPSDAAQFTRNVLYARRMGWLSVSPTGNIALGAGAG